VTVATNSIEENPPIGHGNAPTAIVVCKDGAVYTVDPAGNRTAKTDKHANITSNYTYDPLYELTQVMQSTTTTESYSFDPVGNRLSSLGVSPYSVNTSNELTSIPGTTYTYDNNGNTLTKVTSSGTTTYGWDFENRLTSVTLPATGGTLAFKYDGLGRRVQKAFTQGSTTTTTNYLYDVSNAVADVDQSGNVLARYAATQNIDEPMAELRSTTTSYYSQDGLDSVTSLTTSAGALGNTYTYDSFGKLTSSNGSIGNRFQYTARERSVSPPSTRRAVCQSCSTTLRSEVLIWILPLYRMKPNFLNLFMNIFTRERVVPTISASVSCDIFGSTVCGLSAEP
jgi:YD repeat-containing protein